MSDGGGIGCWEGQVVNEPAPKREIITHAGSLLLISIIISESVPQGAQLYPTELHISLVVVELELLLILPAPVVVLIIAYLEIYLYLAANSLLQDYSRRE